MEMNVEHRIAASPQRVWEALNDVDVLRAAIPGCESLEADEDNSLQAKVTTRIGPVKARFNFHVTLTDLNPPHSYTINAEGQGGAAGFANGSAAVTLSAEGDDTVLAYHAQAHVGGKLAQLGARLIDGTAKKLADEFFTNFGALVEDGESQEPEAAAEAEKPTAQGGMPTWIWLAVAAAAGVIAWQLLGG
jgi:carbon monoxide dehydrogenase subunit G